MKLVLSLIWLLLISFTSKAQDSLDIRFQQVKIGIGIDAAAVTAGPHLMYYSNNWLITFTYGLPGSSNSNNVIKAFDNALYFRGAYAIGSIANELNFWPLYIGIGYTRISEKNIVLNYSGDGNISGLSYFLGYRMLHHNTDFLSSIGVHFELGYSSWYYSQSLLIKNKSLVSYNYPKFYFSVGAYYYIK